MSGRRFAWALESMRSGDPQSRENGFDFLREHADTYVDELIAEFQKEQEDHGLRCWLLELVAEARSSAALPLLASQLEGEDEALQFWAVRGLEMLDSRDANQALHRARTNGWIA
jgi:hypothetical protein